MDDFDATDTFDPYAGSADFDCGDLLADVASYGDSSGVGAADAILES